MVESCQFIRPVYFNLTLLNLKLLFWQHQSFINKCRDIDCWNKIAFDRNIFRKLISERQTCVLDYRVEKNFIYFKIEIENFANCEFNEFWSILSDIYCILYSFSWHKCRSIRCTWKMLVQGWKILFPI